MKRQRMIVTSVIILAIVSSAFAFTAKKVGTYCKSTTDQLNQNCAILHFLMIEEGQNNTFYDPTWNGNAANCLPGKCPTPIRLVDN